MKSAAAALVLVAALVGCSDAGPTRIDGSLPETFARTVARARQELSPADQLMFDSAIATVPARRYGDHDPSATARAAFDGLTAAEVVASETDRTKRIP